MNSDLRQPVLQVIEAAEELPIGVLHPALAHLLIRQILAVLQVGKPDHQPGRLAGTPPRRVIQRAEFGLAAYPVAPSASRTSGRLRSS